ncbi:hypothetical protein Agabi119p4_9074 [Agaricus bisporus var. burnettii]|uniref:Uncharacterized protein n=1 Tax=Agaricus bisporus var. burnettii TaxID=192524 RepID=A0A8H7C4Y2_AGABI|nr:hypothetical protein Agabi119p4_9074 [Agaricus bisporus var. burnettii]
MARSRKQPPPPPTKTTSTTSSSHPRAPPPVPPSKPLRQTRNTAQGDIAPKPVKAIGVATSSANKPPKAINMETESANAAIVGEVTAKAKKRTYEDDGGENGSTTMSKRTRTSSVVAKVAEEAQKSIQRSCHRRVKKPLVATKRKRRTKAEIEADKASVEEEKKRQEELVKERERVMDQMNIDEDIDRTKTVAQAIRTFAELDAASESGEEFPGIDEVPSSDDDTEADGADESNEAMDVTTLKKTNKAMLKTIKALRRQTSGGRKNGLTPDGKKSTKTMIFASGLRPDLDHGKKTQDNPTHIQISAGGLNDSDVEDVNPFSPSLQSRRIVEPKKKGTQKSERDFSRRNEMIAFVEPVDQGNVVPQPRGRKAATKAASKIASYTAAVKVEPVRDGALPREDSGYDRQEKEKTKQLNGNSVRMADLPEFATMKWRDTFLPTLYDRFFTSSNPFSNFSVSSPAFVGILQDIINEVYPEANYIVTASDSIHFLAYNRINEKRSSVGSNAIKVLEAHVRTLRGEKAAKEWLRWCLWPGGPLLFQIPSPIRSEEPPEGRLLSPFIIALAKPLLKLKRGSTFEDEPPQGLIALIAAALERAARHLYSPEKNLTEFSKEAWGSHVEAYWKSFQPSTELGNEGVERERWDELVEQCLEKPQKEIDQEMLEADLSILDDKRPLIFNFRSPCKSRRL